MSSQAQESAEFDQASAELHTVLNQPAYQPRGSQKSWVQQMWETHGASIWENVKESLRWLHQKLPDVEEPEWLRSLGHSISGIFNSIIQFIDGMSRAHWFLPVTLLAAFVVILWSFREKILGVLATFPRTRSVNALVADLETEIDVKAAFECGRYREVIEGIRSNLRKRFNLYYGIKRSISDRELVRRIARDHANANLFRETTDIFEVAAFAGRQIDETKVKRIYHEFAMSKGSDAQ